MAMSRAARVVVILLATAGVFVSRLTPLRLTTTAIVLGTTAALWFAGVHPSPALAVSAFVTVFAARYAFLFASFKERGIAPWLRARLGVRRGFALYEAVTAIAFFLRGLTFAWLVDATSLPTPAIPSAVRASATALGLLCALAGTVINVWSTEVVGLDTYFYGDLFAGRLPPRGLKMEGPYRVFRNPMYGVGQTAAYGLALAALSPVGMAATLLNQIAMFVFNARVEQPHLARVRVQG